MSVYVSKPLSAPIRVRACNTKWSCDTRSIIATCAAKSATKWIECTYLVIPTVGASLLEHCFASNSALGIHIFLYSEEFVMGLCIEDRSECWVGGCDSARISVLSAWRSGKAYVVGKIGEIEMFTMDLVA